MLLGWIGFALTMLGIFAAIVATLKPGFARVFDQYFLPSIAGLVFVGAFVLLVAVLLQPYRKTPRAIGVILWTLIALTSPLFGWLFLVPWALLLLTAPLVYVALNGWSRTAQPAAAS